MGRAIAAISGSTAGFLHRPLLGLGHSLSHVWHDLSRLMFQRYRPERHYMRGPGPACAAKRANAQN